MKKKFMGTIATVGMASMLFGCSADVEKIQEDESKELTELNEQADIEIKEELKEIPKIKEGVSMNDVEKEIYEEMKSKLGGNYYSKMAIKDMVLYGELDKESEFSDEDVYRVIDYLDVDWNAMAYATAESYIDGMAFSKEGLINQLMFEMFTEEEAKYGVNKLEINWDEQVNLAINSYRDNNDISDEELRDMLIKIELFDEKLVDEALEKSKK